jgi:rRNA maturation endonuclease Nob1
MCYGLITMVQTWSITKDVKIKNMKNCKNCEGSELYPDEVCAICGREALDEVETEGKPRDEEEV